jgi:hypothetical protein
MYDIPAYTSRSPHLTSPTGAIAGRSRAAQPRPRGQDGAANQNAAAICQDLLTDPTGGFLPYPRIGERLQRLGRKCLIPHCTAITFTPGLVSVNRNHRCMRRRRILVVSDHNVFNEGAGASVANSVQRLPVTSLPLPDGVTTGFAYPGVSQSLTHWTLVMGGVTVEGEPSTPPGCAPRISCTG